jgi:FKBP-type peptidyl-prolyl cis-trans isomerase FkpA
MKSITPILLIIGLITLSFGEVISGEIKTTKNGLKYQFHISNPDARLPNPGDFLEVKLAYTINDSLLFDSRNLTSVLQLQLAEPSFKGDFFEGVAMMHLGDSASFWSPADSVMLKIFRTGMVPPFVKPGDEIQFNVKLMDIKSPEEFELHRQQQLDALRDNAPQRLEAYIKSQSISTKPTASGLYYIESKAGNGLRPQPGQKVSVHYTGKLLDGTVFDSSVERGEPITFTLGIGQVIPGWDEGIALMQPGAKATLIIPSNLAYGERDMGVIPPHSPLIFEVELVDIVD